MERSVTKLLSENENLRKEREHLKSIYKDQFDSIRKTRVQSKEHCDSLIAQINAKSLENLDLNAQLKEKVFAMTGLKNELRKLKGKNVVNTAISKSIATLAPGMFKVDIEPISARLKNNRDAHEVYIEKTIEYADTLRGFVECARTHARFLEDPGIAEVDLLVPSCGSHFLVMNSKLRVGGSCIVAAATVWILQVRIVINTRSVFVHFVDKVPRTRFPVKKLNMPVDQVDFRRISLTGFHSCASCSQTGTSQSRKSTK
ncbi:hypothetical protein Tco_1083448 [Tanacetum coccineum]